MSDQWQAAASAAAKRHLAAQDLHVGTCKSCGDAITEDDRIRKDGTGGYECGACGDSPATVVPAQAVSDPAPTVKPMDDTKKGPWFLAQYPGVCSAGGESVETDDEIRADGRGGYECSNCAEDDTTERECSEPECNCGGDGGPEHELAVIGAFDDTTPLPTADEFLSPTLLSGPKSSAVTFSTADEFMDPSTGEKPPKINVSGQPEAKRDWLGRYIVIDPELGDFRRTQKGNPYGITRVTTFVKAAANNKAIGDWQKRNVVIGASLRPDVLRRAHGLRHDTGDEDLDKVIKDKLDRIVGELDTAAGGKVSADEGTYLHSETEYIDAGLKQPEDCPAAYQADLKRYVAALAKHGLEPVPGLIERTVSVTEFGGVVGTFDRVFYHRASGTYIIGDLKTGKTLKYGMDEIQAQMWFYAHGINQNGVYDWNTNTWGPADAPWGESAVIRNIKVREDMGVIIHMPVQGPQAGDVYVRKADLVKGAGYAALCASVRDWPKSKVEDWVGLPADPQEAPVVSDAELSYGNWTIMFSEVTTGEEATALWHRVKAVGIGGIKLNALIGIAQQSLRVKG